jgi:hypothetical protein
MGGVETAVGLQAEGMHAAGTRVYIRLSDKALIADQRPSDPLTFDCRLFDAASGILSGPMVAPWRSNTITAWPATGQFGVGEGGRRILALLRREQHGCVAQAVDIYQVERRTHPAPPPRRPPSELYYFFLLPSRSRDRGRNPEICILTDKYNNSGFGSRRQTRTTT